jgi:hypothetical protein
MLYLPCYRNNYSADVRGVGKPSLISLSVLLALGLLLVLTNNRISLIDDEVLIFEAASRPASETIHLFVSGEGQHEHPPLSNLRCECAYLEPTK